MFYPEKNSMRFEPANQKMVSGYGSCFPPFVAKECIMATFMATRLVKPDISTPGRARTWEHATEK